MKTPGRSKAVYGRREFLTGRFLVPEEKEREKTAAQCLGPPPPAVPLRRDSSNPCRECAAPCLASCEPQIIKRHPPDHVLAGMAYLSFENSGCTFCGDCIEVCPLEVPIPTGPGKLGELYLSTDRCVTWDGVICRSCEWACTYEAIKMDSRGRPRIDSKACTGCGFCIGVCPTTALEVR